MSYNQTRAQLLDRVALDRQESFANSSTFSRESVRQYLDLEWQLLHQRLAEQDSPYALTETTLTADGTGVVALPADLLGVRQVKVKNGTVWADAFPTTRAEVVDKGYEQTPQRSNVARLYLLDTIAGPPRAEVLRFYPQLPDGHQVRLAYSFAAPSLANSDGAYTDALGNAEDSSIVVNLFQPELADLLVSLARARAANRADTKEYELASARVGDVIARLANVHKVADRPIRPLSSFSRRTRQ